MGNKKQLTNWHCTIPQYYEIAFVKYIKNHSSVGNKSPCLCVNEVSFPQNYESAPQIL